MKRFLLTTKSLTIFGTISLIALISISSMGNSIADKQSSLYKMSSAVGVCFQRVNQTFTALMIRDFSSSYMSSDFKNTTGECFSQLANDLKLAAVTGVNAKSQLNNLISDLHWFDQKVAKIANMAQETEVDLFQSNIIRKYEDLEGLRLDIEDGILTSAAKIDGTKALAMVGMIISQLALLFAIVGLFMKKKMVQQGIEDVEKFVTKSEGAIEHNVLAQKALKKLFGAIDTPRTKNFITNYLNLTIEENYRIKDHLIAANTVGGRVEIAQDIPAAVEEVKSDFNKSVTAVLDRVSEKAFNHGIILDTDVQDGFYVKSPAEALDQFLFYIVSFAMDSSLDHNEGRKVIVTGKPLGGIAYCKVKIAGHAFSDEEFAIINGKDPNKDTNIHLVLLKELISDTGARLAVKNKNNPQLGTVESEMEIIFDRAHAPEDTASNQRVSVLKGTKKDLIKFFNPEAQA